jgi:hypothetical protein
VADKTGVSALAVRLRWRIAYLMNRLPGQCWADLVQWAVTERREHLERRLPWRPVGACRVDLARTGTCYCGKLGRPER